MAVNWIAISLFVTLFLAWNGLLVGIIKWLLDRNQKHIDGRFEAIDKRFAAQEAARIDEADEWRRLERELMQLRADLPERYVRREDWIRFAAVIDAKQDALGQKLERLLERKNT